MYSHMYSHPYSKRRTRAGASLMALASVLAAFSLAACADTKPDQIAGPDFAASSNASGASGAGSSSGVSNANSVIYDQVEFLGNPLVSEVTIVKANHESYNKTQPYNTATFRPQTEAFVTSFGRPQALASTLGSVLYPDILIVDATKNVSTAGWLSWALSAGWGGRKLTDDVVDLGLSAIFSTFLSNEPTALCAPFKLPLCTDNVGANDKPFLSVFPYLADPTI